MKKTARNYRGRVVRSTSVECVDLDGDRMDVVIFGA